MQISAKNQIKGKVTSVIHGTSYSQVAVEQTDADGNSYDEFNDPEMRYRQRYADLAVNPHVKTVFVKRTKLFNAMRNFFNDAVKALTIKANGVIFFFSPVYISVSDVLNSSSSVISASS